MLTAGALTDHRLPATASNVCTTDARLCGVGRVAPQKNPGYARDDYGVKVIVAKISSIARGARGPNFWRMFLQLIYVVTFFYCVSDH